MNDRLYRSRDDRMLAGVAGGLAEYWDADPSLIRIVWALLVIFTGGLALIAYIVMAIVVPEDPGWAVSANAVGPAAVAPPPALVSPPPTDWRAQRAASRAAARETRRTARAARGGGSHTGALIVGGTLVLLGVWFFLEEYVPAFNGELFWPLAFVGLGAVILVAALRPRVDDRPDAAATPAASATPVAPATPVVAAAPASPAGVSEEPGSALANEP
jgi:phage shock protein C